MKVLFTTNLPSPYRVEFFNLLGKQCELTVLFERKTARNRDSKWKSDDFSGFRAVFMAGVHIGEEQAFCPSIIKYLSDSLFDHIVIGNYSSPTGMMAIQYLKRHQIPFILNSDGGMVKDDSALKFHTKKHFIGAASWWLSTGKMTSQYLVHYGADPERIGVYPFTSLHQADILKQPLSAEEKAKYKKKLGIKEPKAVISVGQFIYRKGYDILLKACADISKDVGIYIIGGEVTEEYIELKESLGLTNVYFIGFMNKKELAEYYKAADLFVLPTREDIWGLVVNEALAYGIPVISTDHCNAGLELIQNGVNGYIVPAEDVGELRNTIEMVLNRNTVSAAKCLESIREYTIEEMAQCHINFFEHIKTGD